MKVYKHTYRSTAAGIYDIRLLRLTATESSMGRLSLRWTLLANLQKRCTFEMQFKNWEISQNPLK